MGIVLRAAVDSEKEAIFTLYEKLFRWHIDQIWGWNDEWQREDFKARWHNARTEVIECDGSAAGYLQTERGSEPEHLHVLSLGVSIENQGRGIGTCVMNKLMCRAADRHLPVRLNVFRTNPEALRFYFHLGFERSSPSESGVMLQWQGKFPPGESNGEQDGAGNLAKPGA